MKDYDIWANKHRNKWHLGRIVEPFPDRKGLVRQVSVNVCSDDGNVINLKRPISKLVLLLPAENDDANEDTTQHAINDADDQ